MTISPSHCHAIVTHDVTEERDGRTGMLSRWPARGTIAAEEARGCGACKPKGRKWPRNRVLARNTRRCAPFARPPPTPVGIMPGRNKRSRPFRNGPVPELGFVAKIGRQTNMRGDTKKARSLLRDARGRFGGLGADASAVQEQARAQTRAQVRARAQARTQTRVQTHTQPHTRTQQDAARKSAPTRSSKTPRSLCAPRRCRPCWTPPTASASTARPHRSR